MEVLIINGHDYSNHIKRGVNFMKKRKNRKQEKNCSPFMASVRAPLDGILERQTKVLSDDRALKLAENTLDELRKCYAENDGEETEDV